MIFVNLQGLEPSICLFKYIFAHAGPSLKLLPSHWDVWMETSVTRWLDYLPKIWPFTRIKMCLIALKCGILFTIFCHILNKNCRMGGISPNLVTLIDWSIKDIRLRDWSGAPDAEIDPSMLHAFYCDAYLPRYAEYKSLRTNFSAGL